MLELYFGCFKKLFLLFSKKLNTLFFSNCFNFLLKKVKNKSSKILKQITFDIKFKNKYIPRCNLK